MDVLASCNVTELPEQQTRTQHLPERVLEDENLELGFSVCCRCASPQTSVECPACRRVKYCSHECRQQDASIVPPASELDDLDDEDDNNAMGHSSIICALLQTCNDDERAETVQNLGVHHSAVNQVALARVESEYESYPATLAQMLQEGSCFQAVMRRKAQSNLVIHILGAARDAELEWKYHLETNWVDCYCQALSDLIESYNLNKLQLYFCGPDVVATDDVKGIQAVSTKKQTGTSADKLELFLCPGNYTHDVISKIPKLDIAIMFNPGLTCPDYPSWNTTLYCIPSGTPILLCTNTQMEVLADIQFLLEHGHVRLNSLPPPWMGAASPTSEDDAARVGGNNNNNNNSSSITTSNTSDNFWGENAYAGWRVRQSSSMANDVYVKNRWMFGGIMDRQKGPPTSATRKARRKSSSSSSPLPPPSTSPSLSKSVVASANNNNNNNKKPQPLEKEGNRKRRKSDENENSGSANNSKRSNPALI